MFLVPQQFQQADRYHESHARRQVGLLGPFGYGVAEFKASVNAEGQFVVEKCVGRLPDGMLIDVPGFDAPPPSRPIAPNFEAKRERLGVLIAAAAEKPNQAGTSTDGVYEGKPTRYRQVKQAIRDDNAADSGNERDVLSMTKNLRIVFESEATEDLTTVRVAELQRSATGAFELSPTYVPPLLSCAVSPYILSILERVIGQLSQRSDALSKQRQQSAKGLAQFTIAESANFLFLHTVNSFIPGLAHLYRQNRTHPELVYLELARLIGELCTFASDVRPTDVPPYNHDNLGATFDALDKRLRALLETVITTRYRTIELVKKGAWYTAQMEANDVEEGKLVLGVAAQVKEDKIVTEIPTKSKVSSLAKVNQIIASALPGVTLKFMPAAPAAIPTQVGWKYFNLERTGEHWTSVKDTRNVAIYVPPEFTDLKLELFSVKE